MNNQEYDKVRRSLLNEAEKIQTAKRPGYTQGDSDVLKNFKSVGERVKTSDGRALGSGPAWSVYFLKHIDAIMSIINQPHLPVSEDPLGRFADAINYLQLGYALYVESRQGAGTGTAAPMQVGPTIKEIQRILEEGARTAQQKAEQERLRQGQGPWIPASVGPFIGGGTAGLPVVPKTIELKPVETGGGCSDPSTW